jgi:hypothetical protein
MSEDSQKQRTSPPMMIVGSLDTCTETSAAGTPGHRTLVAVATARRATKRAKRMLFCVGAVKKGSWFPGQPHVTGAVFSQTHSRRQNNDMRPKTQKANNERKATVPARLPSRASNVGARSVIPCPQSRDVAGMSRDLRGQTQEHTLHPHHHHHHQLLSTSPLPGT